jgi:hypothetical protein
VLNGVEHYKVSRHIHFMTIIAVAFTPGYGGELSDEISMYGAETSRIFIVYLYLI